MVKVNGEFFPAEGKTLAQYLETTSYNPLRIAVECNGDIIPKADYAKVILKDGDSLEIVSFVGGG